MGRKKLLKAELPSIRLSKIKSFFGEKEYERERVIRHIPVVEKRPQLKSRITTDQRLDEIIHLLKLVLVQTERPVEKKKFKFF